MAEYLIREESLIELADAIRDKFVDYDTIVELISNRSGLESITIPDSVTSIGSNAFSRCTKLANIYLSALTPPSLASTGTIPNTTIIHVPIGSGDIYKSATNWSSHASRIIEDIDIRNEV